MKAEPNTLAMWAVFRPSSVGCAQTTYKRPRSAAVAVTAIQVNKEGRQQTPTIQVCWILAPCAGTGWEQSLCPS